jgi:hypothetical protein
MSIIRDMAGEIVSGDPGESVEPSWAPEYDMITVEEGDFSCTAIPLYNLPGFQVLDAMTSPEQIKMEKMFALFKLSLNDGSGRVEEGLSRLDFIELNRVVGSWVAQSVMQNMTDSDVESALGLDSDGIYE